MSIWLPAFFSALAGILIGAFAWATRRREQSGKIDTSSAAVLWDAINRMLETALADNAAQRVETRELETRIAALQVEIAGLRAELRELRGKVS